MPLAALGPIIGSAIIGGAASTVGGFVSSQANKSAARDQLNAQNHAADLEYQANQDALAAAREENAYQRWLTSATGEARRPYLQSLEAALSRGAPSYTAPTFTPPTMAEATNDPGYQFAVGEGQKGLERSAASRGTLLTGGTLKDALAYNQDMAAMQYDRVYNRARSTFDTNAQNAFQTASLNASGFGQTLAGLGSLASLASPGAYPGGSLTALPSVGGPVKAPPINPGYGTLGSVLPSPMGRGGVDKQGTLGDLTDAPANKPLRRMA